SYVALTQSMLTHDLGRDRGGTDEALASIRARTLALAVDSDRLFPPSQSRRIADGVQNGTYRELRSDHGHDVFLWRTSRWRRSSRSSCRAETPPPTPRPPATLNRFVRYFQRPVVPAGIDPPRAVTNATGRRSPAVEEAHAELVGGLLQHLLHGK